MSHPYLGAGPRPRILAHRGFVSPESAAAGTVENTRAAVAAALAAGADYVESDCHLTSDGEVVLFHDSDLVRTLGDPRRVSEVPLPELDRLMAPSGGLLTLAGALEEFPDARFNIDVKTRAVSAPAGAIIGAAAPERVLISSFSDGSRVRAIAAAKEAGGLPAVGAGQRTIATVLAAVALGARRPLARALRGIDALQIPERHGAIPVLSGRLLRAAHAHGVEVHVWTVNEGRRMRELVARGVDGIVTDRTDIALSELRG